MLTVQQIAKNDTSNMSITNYNFYINKSDEKEKSRGLNFKYDFRLTNFISGSLKLGNKSRTKNRSLDRHHEFGNVAAAAGLAEPRAALVEKLGIDSLITDPRRIPLLAVMDENYNGNDFFKGKYSFGAVADLDKMMDIYNYFSQNWNKQTTNSTIDEYVMHHIHQTNSQIYDYSGEEEYNASYFMADINFGSKFNLIAGGRREENVTTYNSNSSLDHALPHWIYVGESESHNKK